jgi:hypothetical protein
MDPAAYEAFTRALAARLEGDPDVLGLVALGSMSGEPPGPDAWSDHDFFVVTRPGAQERFRTDPGWLPAPERIALLHRETAHGLKVIWDDGHLAELAVFDPGELSLAKVNRHRVLLDREGTPGALAARMAEVRAATVAQARASATDPRWEAGQLLGTLLVGALRAARGERASGDLLVRAYAARHFLALVHATVPPAPGARPDDLDPFRRIEEAWPRLATALEAALAPSAPASARALLALARETFGDPPLSRRAAAAVLARIAEAEAAAAAGRVAHDGDPRR